MVQIVSLPTKLLWTHIKEMYQNEWVELIDCDWERESARPIRAIVRNHSSDRVSLLRRAQRSKPNSRSVILYVGMTDSVVSFDPAGAVA